MFVITLIANPDRRDLSPGLVDSLRNAWGGGNDVWLAPDEAAEFAVQQVPSNQWTRQSSSGSKTALCELLTAYTLQVYATPVRRELRLPLISY